MATEFTATEITGPAVMTARRVRDALAAVEDLYGFLSGLTADDLVNCAGGGMSEARAVLIKSCVTELHDLACKFAGTTGMTDSGQSPLALPHDYRVLVSQLVGPRVLA